MATKLQYEEMSDWGPPELSALARVLPYCSRCVELSLHGCDLSTHEASEIVADMLSRQACPVTRLGLRRTHITAGAVERLLASPRLKAIELSELPLYGSDEVLQLAPPARLIHTSLPYPYLLTYRVHACGAVCCRCAGCSSRVGS